MVDIFIEKLIDKIIDILLLHQRISFLGTCSLYSRASPVPIFLRLMDCSRTIGYFLIMEPLPVGCVSHFGSSNGPCPGNMDALQCALNLHKWEIVLSRRGGCLKHSAVFESNVIIFGQLAVFFFISEEN